MRLAKRRARLALESPMCVSEHSSLRTNIVMSNECDISECYGARERQRARVFSGRVLFAAENSANALIFHVE